MLTAGEGVGKFSVDLHGAKIQPHPRSLSRGEGGRGDFCGDESEFYKIDKS